MTPLQEIEKIIEHEGKIKTSKEFKSNLDDLNP